MNTDIAIEKIKIELNRASIMYPPFRSTSEGYAIILEELDELWDAIKLKADRDKLEEEAIQLAAMALRFLMDIC